MMCLRSRKLHAVRLSFGLRERVPELVVGTFAAEDVGCYCNLGPRLY
jgi:hypothetical protein